MVTTCRVCGAKKAAIDFYVSTPRECKACVVKRTNAAAKAAREAGKRPDVQHRAEQRRSRARQLGLTTEQYDAMCEQADGLCAICRNEETAEYRGVRKALALDHCHSTGRVRGLLCDRCNRGIGYLGHDPDRLMAAAAYLPQHSDVLQGAAR